MKFYFAGGLFTHKELIGNQLLANSVERVSDGKWHAVLPQKAENQLRFDALEIRDNDLRMVIEADAGLFNFDGTELDSGTVVEFMVARMLDLPCVLFRSDFRSAGDQNADGEPWNLMCSGYPRTVTVRFDCMARYQAHFDGSGSMEEALRGYYHEMGVVVAEALNRAKATEPLLKTPKERLAAYRNVVMLCGGTLPKRFPDHVLKELVE